MQLVFTGAVSWSPELECQLGFVVVVVVFRMLFLFSGNSEQQRGGEGRRRE